MQGEREREKGSRGGGRKGITWNGTLISYEGALTSKCLGEEDGGKGKGKGRGGGGSCCLEKKTKEKGKLLAFYECLF